MKLPELSIRARFTFWFGLLLAGILAGFGVTAYRLKVRDARERIDDELVRRVERLQEDWMASVPPGGEGRGGRRMPGPRGSKREPVGGDAPADVRLRLSPPTTALFAGEGDAAFYYAAWTQPGVLLAKSAGAPADVPRPTGISNGLSGERTRAGRREVYHVTEFGDCVLAGIELGETEQAERRFAWGLVAAGGLVLLLGVGGTWGIAARALRPVKEIGATATRIAAGNLAERIATPGAATELSELAAVLNATFARLDAAFAEQRNFTADASHELRTPLAAIITTLQVSLMRERSGADYREAMASCLRAAQQMARLTDSLLALARFDAGQEPLVRVESDMAEIAGEAVALVRPLAEQREVRFEEELGPAAVRGDAERLRQVVSNLLVNAVQHGRGGGSVRIATRTEEGRAVLTVADDGPGIAAEDLPQVFRRFYRGDKVRSRETGRSGLGLAISKAVVEAHGGTITVESVVGAGATFTLRLPG